jgi:WW domain
MGDYSSTPSRWENSQEYMQTAKTATRPTTAPVVNTTNSDTSNTIHTNAFLLESLLHELTFWEPTPKEFLRKSQSASAAIDYTNKNKQNSKPQLRTAASFGEHEELRNHHHHQPQTATKSGSRSIASLTTTTTHNPNNNATTTQTNNHANNSAAEEQLLSRSPTLPELQAACSWQKAVDPATGRTYYYDVHTRQTQWEKVRAFAVSSVL